MMNFRHFIRECHKMDVFKILSIYIVSSWVLLQVLAVTWEALGIPQKTITYLIVLLLAGFPVYILLVWKFHLAPKKKDEDYIEEVSIKKTHFYRLYFSSLGIITTLCVITIFLIMGNSTPKANSQPITVESNKIAILKFGNNTGNPA